MQVAHLSNLLSTPCKEYYARYRVQVHGQLSQRTAGEDCEQAIEAGDLVEYGEPGDDL